MYAVMQTGGKQYKVAEGDIIRVESIDKDLKATVVFDSILLLNDNNNFVIGKPYVNGVSVMAEIISHNRRKKIIVFKKKRTKTYQRTKGHRQNYTEVRIMQINA